MKKGIAVVSVLALLFSGTAYASETGAGAELEELRRMLKEQNRLIEQLLHRVEALESGQAPLARIEPVSEEPVWTERVRLKGDFRYRYEHIDDDRKSDNRNRNRIRARIGVEAEVTDTVDVGFQLSTSEPSGAKGGGDPISDNQTLTGAFELKNVWFSQAWADWHPAAVPGLHVIGGKMKRPFFTVGKSELIWDDDLNPEGVAVKYKKSYDTVEAFGNAFGFWAAERSADADTGLFGAQGGLKKSFTAFGNKAHALAGLSYYDYGNIEGEAPFFDGDGDDFGNTLDAGGALKEDFDLFEIFGEFGFRARNIPVLVFADYVTNTAASGEDDGWSVGFKVGKASEPGSWQFRYLYKDIEKDAVVGGFTDSDFRGGGTDARGHEINLAYQIAKNWRMVATYFHNETGIAKGEDEEDYDRLQLDMTLKF